MHAIQAAPRVAPSAGLQGHGGGADAAARTPAVAPTPAAAALAVAAATDAQGRRRALRELDAAVDGHTAAPMRSLTTDTHEGHNSKASPTISCSHGRRHGVRQTDRQILAKTASFRLGK